MKLFSLKKIRQNFKELREFLTTYPRYIMMLILVTITPLVIITIIFLFLTATVPSHVVPKLEGLSILDATAVLQESHLEATLIEQNSETVPRYFILKQDITAGRKIKEGRPLILYISSGGSAHSFPSFIGKNFYQVKNMIAQQDENKEKIFLDKVIWTSDTDKPFGEIISQSPKKGNYKEFPLGVSFTVSKGNHSNMPFYTNRPLSEALFELIQKGFKPVITEKDISSPDKDGLIIDQSPEVGAKLKEGDFIHFTVGMYHHKDSLIKRFTFQVPTDLNNQTISILLADSRGITTLYSGPVKKGDVIIENPMVLGNYKITLYRGEGDSKEYYKDLNL